MSSYFESSVKKAQTNYDRVYEETRHTIGTAHHCFGGHISKGLYRRGINAKNKLADANDRLGIRKIMLSIYMLPEPYTRGYWKAIDEVLNNCLIWKYPVDDFDYWGAVVAQYCKPKIKGLKNFVNIHGNSIDKRVLIPVLQKSRL